MASVYECPECGVVVPQNTHRNLCPSCLLRQSRIPEPDAGDLVDDFRLVECIGKGGMGVVFRAEQLHPVRREVAFKLIKPGMDSEDVIARFESERQALALMDHPNIARVLGSGATLSGRPYFIMELVSGIPMTEFCDSNNLSIGQRLDLFRQLCRAVQHAHQKGVIHRDLKPTNLLVDEVDGAPHLKVIDFGVAKALQQPLTDRTLQTMAGQAIGTPVYMSPEQAAGQPDIDTRADIYSLGALLYELLTGSTPFDEARFRATDREAIVQMLRMEEPPAPSRYVNALGEKLPFIAGKRSTEPRTLRRQLLKDLDWIVLKALEKNRDRRYSSAAELEEDLRRHLNHEPVLAGRPSAFYLLSRFGRRHRMALAATGATALALIAGSMLSLWHAVRATRAETVARRQSYYAQLGNVMRQLKEGRSGLLQELLTKPEFVSASKRFRGWEWLFLEALSDRSLASYPAHPEGVATLAATRDGQRLASMGRDGHLKIWNARDRSLNLEWEARVEPSVLDWNPADQRLAAGDSSGRVQLWDKAGKLVEAGWPAHSAAILALRWSPDGKLLATSGSDGNVVVWNAQTRRPIARIKHGVAASAVTWAPDNDRIALGSGEIPALIEIWSATSGKLVGTLKEPFETYMPVLCLAWQPGGQQIAAGTANWYVKVFDVQTGQITYHHRLHRGPVRSVSWSSNGQKLATASDDGTIRVQHFDLIRHYMLFPGHLGAVRSVSWCANDSLLATGAQDGTVRLWPTVDLGDVVTHSRVAGWLSSLAFDPQGRRLAMAWGNTPVEVWDTESEVGIHRLAGHEAPVHALSWSADGSSIAGGDRSGSVHLWAASTGEKRRTISGFRPIRSVLWSPKDQRLLVLEDVRDEAVLLDALSGKQIWTLRIPQSNRPFAASPGEALLAAAWSSDGRHVVLGDAHGQIAQFDVAQHRLERARSVSSAAIQSVDWRPSSSLVVLGQDDGMLRTLDLERNKNLWTTRAHRGAVRLVAWHPDGRRIATAGEDGLVKLFDAATGEEVLEVTHHFNHVTGLAWSGNGRKLATGSHDFDVWVFDASPRNPNPALHEFETALFLRQPWVAGGEHFDPAVWSPRALRLLDSQLQLDPQASLVHAQHARILLSLGRLVEAEHEAQTVLAQLGSSSGKDSARQMARDVLLKVQQGESE